MSWDDAKRAKEGSSFIKLKDGESINLVLRGEPYIFYQAYPDKTEWDTWAEGRTTRFKIACVTPEGGEYKGKILGGGRSLLVTLYEMKEEYGLDVIYKLKRVGEGTDTKYMVMFKDKLDEETLAKVEDVDLPRLGNGRSRTDEEPPPLTDDDFNPETDELQEEEIPF